MGDDRRRPMGANAGRRPGTWMAMVCVPLAARGERGGDAGRTPAKERLLEAMLTRDVERMDHVLVGDAVVRDDGRLDLLREGVLLGLDGRGDRVPVVAVGL